MKAKMAEFDKKYLPHAFGLFLSRFDNEEKTNAYLNEAMPYIEQVIE